MSQISLYLNKHTLSIRIISLMSFALIIWLFSSCKKTIVESNPSSSSIKYFNGGHADLVIKVSPTHDGGFIYCGKTTRDTTRIDAFLLKVDGNGIQQWYKTFGGKGIDDFRYAFETSDGGFLCMGATSSIGAGAFDTTNLTCNYVVKVDVNGNLQWSNSYDSNQSALSYGIETPDHFFLLTGFNFTSRCNPVLLKIDGNGNQIMYRAYQSLNIYPPNFITSFFITYGTTLEVEANGTILIGGLMGKSGSAANSRKMVPFILKVNPNGIGLSFFPFYDFVSEPEYYNTIPISEFKQKIFPLSDGYLIGSSIQVNGGFMKFLLIRSSLSGVVMWQKEYLGDGYSWMHDMIMNTDSTYLMVGMSSKESINSSFPEVFANLRMMLLKINKDGEEIWTRFHGSNKNANIPKGIQQRPDGGWSIGGYTCLSEIGYNKMYFTSFDKDGFLIQNK